MHSDRPEIAPAQADAAQTGANRPRLDDDLNGVIADVERQLESLRTHRAQHEEARTRWQAVEKELTQRQAEMDRRTAEMASEQERLNERLGKLRELDEEMARRTQKMERDFESLAEEQRKAAEASERREADLAARSTTLEQREQRLAEHAASVSRHREQAQALEAEIVKREKAVAERSAEIERIQAECVELRDRATAQEKVAAQRAEALSRAEETARAASTRAEELSRELESLRGSSTQLRQKLEAELASARAEIARAGEAQSELMKSLTERERTISELKPRLAAASAEAEKRGAALSDASERIADFKRQVIERDAKIQEISGKLGAATEKLREVSRSIQQQADLIGQARQMEAELSASAERIAELEARLARSGPDASDAADPGLLAERDSLRARVEQLEDQLANAHARLAAPPAQASRGISPQGDGIPADVGEAIVTRWRRLRTMRTLVREEAAKIRQAGRALKARMAEAEKAAAERQAVPPPRPPIAEPRPRPDAARAAVARPRALAAAIGCIVCIGALAAVSWAIGGQLAPAVFAAKTVIAADTKNAANVSPEQLFEWQKYHESLIKDPTLTDTAAERMGRRGIVSLATPGALLSRLNADLSHDSPGNGQLSFELRGKGAAETTRVLDTFATALVSQANADRERRADGLGTIITQPPTAGDGPIEDQRLLYSSIIFVVGGALSFFSGAAAWRQIARAKAKFEREQMDEMSPAEWDRPPQAYSKM